MADCWEALELITVKFSVGTPETVSIDGLLCSLLFDENAAINGWGVKGWNYTEVLPFFIKSENVTQSTQSNFPQYLCYVRLLRDLCAFSFDSLRYHGLSGPIRISDTPQTAIYSAVPYILASCGNLGYPQNPDFNGASRYGCGKQVFSTYTTSTVWCCVTTPV